MHVLYISGTYMPASGGAEISMFSLLQCLVECGIRVSVVTATDAKKPAGDFGERVGIDVRYVEKESLAAVLKGFCSDESIDLITTQNLWADLAIQFANQTRIPVIYFARNCHGDLDLSLGGKYECNHVIANSQAVADFIFARWRRKASIVRSIVRLEDYQTETNSREFITMVNPLGHKGGAIFRCIARLLPQKRFLAVQGWAHLRGTSGWNVELFRDLSAGFGTDLWLPEEFDFSGITNVVQKSATDDMREIYSETRILLIPSVYAESIPRVTIEAMINGIPVIGSAVGGIKEALSTTGFLISDYQNPREWVTAILKLDDPDRYISMSEASKCYASSLNFADEVGRCVSTFEKVVEAHLQNQTGHLEK